MTDLDTLARSATRELLDRTTPDVPTRYAELKRTRTRRTTAKLVAVAAAVAVAVGGWRVLAGPEERVEPAPSPHVVQNGSLIGITYPNNSDENWWTLLGERLATYPEDVQKYAHLRLTADGSSLVYVNDQGRVVMTRLRDGNERTLAECPTEEDYCDASLSPDGQLLAFTAAGGLRIQRVGTTTSELLAVDGAEFAASPSWSPDGSEIAFSTEDGVYVVAPDGSDLRQLHQFTPRSWYYVPVRWAPDGSLIAFFGLERLGTGSSVARYDVRFTAMVVRPDGTDLRALHHAGHCFCTVTPQPNLVWSPDSELLAVTTALGGGRGVYLVRPDGSGWEEIFGGDIASMVWQPVIE